MDKLKYIKLEKQDGSYSDSIPLAVDSNHVDVNGKTLTETLNNKANITNINNLQNQIDSLASGSPLAASSVAEMTDTSRVYVNTTDGNWYYYNGDSWTIGDIYQSSVSSSETSALNDNMKNYYHNMNGTSGSSSSRIFLPYNFIEGIIYKLKVKFNEVTPTSSASSINFSLRLTTDQTNDTIVQHLILNQRKTDLQTEYEIVFSAPQNANYIYIYQQFASSSVYNYDITVTPVFGDVCFSENDFFYNKDNKKIKNKNSRIGKSITQNINRTRSANTERDFIHFNFKEGLKYYITLILNEYTLSNSNTGLSIKTSSSNSTSSIVEEISGDIQMDMINSRYDFEFNCNNNASYLYLYTGFLVNTNFDVDITILEVYENISLDENDFFYDIDNKVLKLKTSKEYNYTYSGAIIDLSDRKFNCEQYMNITTPTSEGVQGMFIFDGKLFQLQHKGILNVYDFINKSSTPLASCNLGSYSATDNHANCCNFSNKYYDNNIIPLLYVTGGNSANVMECDVENIILTEDNGSYTVTSELIQKITLDQSGFESAGYVPYWGWSCWITSPDNKYLYYFGAKYRTNGSMREYDDDNRYIVTKFHYPNLSDSEVTLTADDVLEQFTTSYEIEVTQGGTLYNDKIYYAFGFGNANFPSKIGVWDLKNKSFVSIIDLSDTVISNQELEDVCIYNNKLYVMTASKKLYELEF